MSRIRDIREEGSGIVTRTDQTSPIFYNDCHCDHVCPDCKKDINPGDDCWNYAVEGSIYSEYVCPKCHKLRNSKFWAGIRKDIVQGILAILNPKVMERSCERRMR